VSYKHYLTCPFTANVPTSWAFHVTSLKATEKTVPLLSSLLRNESLYSSIAGINGSVVNCAMQPISKKWLEVAQQSGGDAIDLDPADGTWISALIVTQWENAEDDARMTAYAQAQIKAIDDAAKAEGIHYPFTYLNDAHVGQEIFSKYGKGKSLKKMQQIAKKYDPQGVFQKLETGGFKLPAAQK